LPTYKVNVNLTMMVEADDVLSAGQIAMRRLTGPVLAGVRFHSNEVTAAPVIPEVNPIPGREDRHEQPHLSELGCMCPLSCCNDKDGNCTCRECDNSDHSHGSAKLRRINER
jgi:hypothetical protein